MKPSDLFPPGQTPPSPCIGVCQLASDGGTCTGCGRTLDEIGAWSSASDAYKLAVWRRIEAKRGAGSLDDTAGPT